VEDYVSAHIRLYRDALQFGGSSRERERYRLFAADRRRQTLDILTGQTEPVDLMELASGIAAREHDLDSADDEAVTHVAVTLHHVHLPMLSQFGIIEYDAERTRIESCPIRTDIHAVSPTGFN